MTGFFLTSAYHLPPIFVAESAVPFPYPNELAYSRCESFSPPRLKDPPFQPDVDFSAFVLLFPLESLLPSLPPMFGLEELLSGIRERHRFSLTLSYFLSRTRCGPPPLPFGEDFPLLPSIPPLRNEDTAPFSRLRSLFPVVEEVIPPSLFSDDDIFFFFLLRRFCGFVQFFPPCEFFCCGTPFFSFPRLKEFSSRRAVFSTLSCFTLVLQTNSPDRREMSLLWRMTGRSSRRPLPKKRVSASPS